VLLTDSESRVRSAAKDAMGILASESIWILLLGLQATEYWMTVDIYSHLKTHLVKLHAQIVDENTTIANAAAIQCQAIAQQGMLTCSCNNYVAHAYAQLSRSSHLAGT
jgi:hypothetical protein